MHESTWQMQMVRSGDNGKTKSLSQIDLFFFQCTWPGDYDSLRLTRIKLHPPNAIPLNNLDAVTGQGLCYCNFNVWGWHNSYKSGLIGIIDQLIRQNGKKLQGVRRNNNGPETLPCGTPDTTLTSLLRQESPYHVVIDRSASLTYLYQARKLPIRSSRRNTILIRGGQNIRSSLPKKRKHTQWVGAPIRVQV